ncbi:MAG: hypothetical protein QM398_13125 [Thermoproteota archaeon]|nr:hypothetical protein [Thermoproteota archaeon]
MSEQTPKQREYCLRYCTRPRYDVCFGWLACPRNPTNQKHTEEITA